MNPEPVNPGAPMTGPSDAMSAMERVENLLSLPPLVDERVLSCFCSAVQSYGDAVGSHDSVAESLRNLRARLDNLRDLAQLCRLAVVGHPHSFARVADELYCLSVDFPSNPLEHTRDEEYCEDEADDRVSLAAAVDLFVGATFISKDDTDQRNRFIVAIVRAIEEAIAFPTVFAAEAAAFVDPSQRDVSPLHASLVIANATQRLLERDENCTPLAPREIRARLEGMACQWMRKNPVTKFFDTITGPKVRRIVHWENPKRDRPDDALIGDPVTLLLERQEDSASSDTLDNSRGEDLRGLAVMFCPHQPARVVRIVRDGLEVRVPEGACTGPIAVVQSTPDFEPVWTLLWEYAQRYQPEMLSSVFAYTRLDVWAYPRAFRGPVLEIEKPPTAPVVSVFTSAGRLLAGQSVVPGEMVAIHYSMGGGLNVPPTVRATGGVVTTGARAAVVFYRPSEPGDQSVQLSWGNVTATVPISVQAAEII